MALFKFSDFALGMIGYVLLVLIADFLLHRRTHTKAPALSYTTGQKIGRAAFVGLIIVIVLVLGKTLDVVWGGIFAMFPAAFSSTLMLLHWYYDSNSVSAAAQNAPIGSLSICVYSIAVMFVFPKFGFIIGTVLAYCASLLTTLHPLENPGGKRRCAPLRIGKRRRNASKSLTGRPLLPILAPEKSYRTSGSPVTHRTTDSTTRPVSSIPHQGDPGESHGKETAKTASSVYGRRHR